MLPNINEIENNLNILRNDINDYKRIIDNIIDK